jgi:hypothetical protein
VKALAKEDLITQKLDAASPGGIFGLTAGRAVTPNGPRVLYMADWQGNILTLTPQ